MSFLKNLAQSFVKSAVNQVGRDGGKIISTNIYRDNGFSTHQPQQASFQRAYENEVQIPDNAKLQQPYLKKRIIFFLMIVGVIFPLGTIVAFIYGLLRFFKRDAKVIWTQTRSTRTRDRRYRSGYRITGTYEISHSAKVPAEDYDIAQYRRQGIIIMSITAIFALINVLILFTRNATS
ncbi:MAG: hypothetical protein K2J29_02045 [Muribaculaceae bacterium]|nr:hypothetical protein [Muribaculaceae bacterium]